MLAGLTQPHQDTGNGQDGQKQLQDIGKFSGTISGNRNVKAEPASPEMQNTPTVITTEKAGWSHKVYGGSVNIENEVESPYFNLLSKCEGNATKVNCSEKQTEWHESNPETSALHPLSDAKDSIVKFESTSAIFKPESPISVKYGIDVLGGCIHNFNSEGLSSKDLKICALHKKNLSVKTESRCSEYLDIEDVQILVALRFAIILKFRRLQYKDKDGLNDYYSAKSYLERELDSAEKEDPSTVGKIHREFELMNIIEELIENIKIPPEDYLQTTEFSYWLARLCKLEEKLTCLKMLPYEHVKKS